MVGIRADCYGEDSRTLPCQYDCSYRRHHFLPKAPTASIVTRSLQSRLSNNMNDTARTRGVRYRHILTLNQEPDSVLEAIPLCALHRVREGSRIHAQMVTPRPKRPGRAYRLREVRMSGCHNRRENGSVDEHTSLSRVGVGCFFCDEWCGDFRYRCRRNCSAFGYGGVLVGSV